MESILWRAPLVYRSTGPSLEFDSDDASEECWGRLTMDRLYLPHHQCIALRDVLGAEIVSATPGQWMLHTYPIKNCSYIYTPRTFTCPSAIAAQDWVNAVLAALGRPQRRSLTVLLNPSSGNQRSLKRWQEIEPIFEQGNYQIQMIQTQSAEDLKQKVCDLDLATCSGLIILGGDGSIHHGVNGLMSRSERTQASQLPLGFIPTGTSNGLVKSILDSAGLEYSVQNAAVAIALGRTRSLDLVQVTQEHRQYFSILSFSWGFFSDVDIESDRLKQLGFLKNYLYTLLRLITYRTYQGVIEIQTQTGWQTVTDDIISLWMMNVPWAAYNFKPAPEAQLSDASFDVWITPNTISRLTFLHVLLKAFDGQHLQMPGVQYLKAQAIKVSPTRDRGIFAIDGEPVPYGPIELQIAPDSLTIFSP